MKEHITKFSGAQIRISNIVKRSRIRYEAFLFGVRVFVATNQSKRRSVVRSLKFGLCNHHLKISRNAVTDFNPSERHRPAVLPSNLSLLDVPLLDPRFQRSIFQCIGQHQMDRLPDDGPGCRGLLGAYRRRTRISAISY